MDIANRLRLHGAKPTAQRLKLAEIIFARPQHLSAEQVLAAAREAGVDVSKATVYNTLNLFVDCGLVREIHVDSDRTWYDSTVTSHHHFFNVDTGELTDIPEAALALEAMPELPPGTCADGVEVVIRVRNER